MHRECAERRVEWSGVECGVWSVERIDVFLIDGYSSHLHT